VTTYTYDAANRLVTARSDDDGITWYYTYDDNGNLLRQTPGGTTQAEGETRYTYDAANRLVRVELYINSSYTLLSEAEYNGIGERMSLTTYAMGTPQTVNYVMAGGQVLVADDGSQATLYLYGQTLIAEYDGSEWSYLLRDSNSSVRQTVDESGAVTSARTYKPFGEILQESGVYESAFGFLGAQLDRVSGLLYANGRYYDPKTGRYLTPNHSLPNPYAPLQGPGLWLLLPFVGIVLLRRRKSGPWRMFVLICVLGTGTLLTGCGGIVEIVPVDGTPTQTPLPQPPSTPVSLPTSTQTSTPPLLSPTPTSTPSPSPTLPLTVTPTPCPTPIPTPTGTSTLPPMQPGSEVYELAEMVYWEEGSEPYEVKRAVAWIAVNRVASDNFPNTLLAVLAESNQFQAYLNNINIDAAEHATTPLRMGQWEEAKQAAWQAISKEGTDPTGGFLFFGNGESIGQEMRTCAENDPTFQYGEIRGNINTFYYSNKWYRGEYCFPK
jgi:RHS repeat-associated protein